MWAMYKHILANGIYKSEEAYHIIHAGGLHFS